MKVKVNSANRDFLRIINCSCNWTLVTDIKCYLMCLHYAEEDDFC